MHFRYSVSGTFSRIGMVLSLPRFSTMRRFLWTSRAASRHHLQVLGWADVVGAAAADQDAARPQHLQRAQVELFVAAQGGFQVLLALGEGGRVEDDGVVVACRRRRSPAAGRKRWLRSIRCRVRSGRRCGPPPRARGGSCRRRSPLDSAARCRAKPPW